MAEDLSELTKLMQAVTRGLAPARRKKVAEKAAMVLQRANRRRIQQNVDPDGRPFTPRKREKHGKVRNKAKMFKKLRELRFLRRKATANGFEVGFLTASAARIAIVHQDGLIDRVDPKFKKTVRYPQRRLLGFSLADDAAITAEILDLIFSAKPAS